MSAAGKFFLPFILKMEVLIILMPVTAKAIFIQYQDNRLLVNGWREEKNSNCNIIFGGTDMRVKTLIEKLQKMNPEAEVLMHGKGGFPVLFVMAAEGIDPVWLECESDTDMADEIQSRFDDAIENGTDELDVYMEMLEAGINVPMVRKYMGNSVADAMQKFCEEHGLI